MKRWSFISLVILLIGLSARLNAAETYQIDAKQSEIKVEVGTSGVFGFMGHAHHIAVRNFSGEIQSTAPDQGSVNVRVTSDSLSEAGEFSEKDRSTINMKMKQDVLETSKYPEILFQSTNATVKSSGEGKYQVQLKGDLTLHGVTRAINFPATVTISGETLRANGSFKIQRDDYNLKTDSAGGGTVKVAKDVKILFNIVATRR